MDDANDEYRRIEKAITFISTNFKNQPSLKEIASAVCLSEFHFQRMFAQWAGISPKKFIQHLTIEYAKKALRESQPLLDVSIDSGFSSGSRLHDLFVTVEGMTPGEYKQFGLRLNITYGLCRSPFGECLISKTEKGICGMAFMNDDSRSDEIERMRANWPDSSFTHDDKSAENVAKQIFKRPLNQEGTRLRCFVKGTQYQLKVWQALLRIPFGKLTTYHEIAKLCGNPESSRAAASATGSNPIAFLIPCHRVILKTGGFSDYRWGANRKRAMIAWEAAHVNS